MLDVDQAWVDGAWRGGLEDDVLSYFDRDRVQIGGKMVTLETGFDQDFADTWRSETKPVKVSGVFAHIFANDSGLEMVDVVEIGAARLSQARKILKHSRELAEAVMSGEVTFDQALFKTAPAVRTSPTKPVDIPVYRGTASTDKGGRVFS